MSATDTLRLAPGQFFGGARLSCSGHGIDVSHRIAEGAAEAVLTHTAYGGGANGDGTVPGGGAGNTRLKRGMSPGCPCTPRYRLVYAASYACNFRLSQACRVLFCVSKTEILVGQSQADVPPGAGGRIPVVA